ncbi:MAG: prepilin-type N-terminal cleavage/methylation domain-containing protein [Candidatus Microgenomates bacterium]|jgi:prepilin-type N-terminal cleavage/methylation domain-containing protein
MKGYTLIRTIRKNFVSVYGYTLIELLVSLTIIGILFSVSYVGFRDFSRRQALTGVVKQVQGDLRLAQQDALSGTKPSSGCNSLDGINFSIDSSTTYSIYYVCDGAVLPVPVKPTATLPPEISISNDTNPIFFKGLGSGTNIPAGSQATITVTQIQTGSQANILVGSGGDVK